MITQDVREVLEKQKYKIVGRHSAVKACHWLRQKLLNRRACYKDKFYGINSHRCIQMTPSVSWCTQKCVFCWRPIELTQGTEIEEEDDPRNIIEGSIQAQRTILTGYGGIMDRVDSKMLEEARNPKHVAISLAGEPTLYSKIGELIKEFHNTGFTTFLVTNGTRPDRLESLEEEPTQLYLSLDAPNEHIYNIINAPIKSDGWKRINETLELLPSFKCNTVIRITCIRGYNMTDLKGYAKLISKGEPTFVEPKSYMHVGYSRKRLDREDMPSFDEIMDFGKELASLTGYEIKDFSRESKVALLA